MVTVILALAALAFGLSVPATMAARELGRRLNALDAPGVPGQVKAPPRRVPNTGGIGVFAALAVPLAGVLAMGIWAGLRAWVGALLPAVGPYLEGLAEAAPKGWVLLGAMAVLHGLGVLDDRRPLPALPKLAVMLGSALAVVVGTDTRLLTLLDPLAGGAWVSIVLTVLWIGVITNAFNFLDNMDGLSGGVGVICAAFFLATAVATPERPQWFIAGLLALLIGALAGFLVFNGPWRARGASIFLGDGGSLVVGFVLGVASVRLTYTGGGEGAEGGGASWMGLLIPLVILAIPLYDFASVCAIRLWQGKSPFVGDLQHFSHRLVRRGLTRRSAVLVICGCAAVTGIGAVALPALATWQGALVGLQTALVLGLLGVLEWTSRP